MPRRAVPPVLVVRRSFCEVARGIHLANTTPPFFFLFRRLCIQVCFTPAERVPVSGVVFLAIPPEFAVNSQAFVPELTNLPGTPVLAVIFSFVRVTLSHSLAPALEVRSPESWAPGFADGS